MRNRLIAAALVAAPLALFGCKAVTPVVNSVDASLIDALTNTLVPGINTAIADGVNATQKDIDTLVYALPWLQAAVDGLGPSVGLSASWIATTDAAIVAVEADLKNPPKSIGQVAVDAALLWSQVKTALSPALKSV